MARFVVLSGPSCVGKGPLHQALKRLYPELASSLETVVLYNSRSPRPGELDGVDYHFRPRADIEELAKQPGYIAADVRGDLQCLEVASVERALSEGKDAFFEGNPFIPVALRSSAALDHVSRFSVFLSPLSRDEILYLQQPNRRVDLGAFLTEVMRRKLLRRGVKQKTTLSLADLEDVERRARSAIAELRYGWMFDYVVSNHDGEDSENWDAFYYPVGDAFRTLEAFTALLRGEVPAVAEKWEEDLVPS